MLWILIDPLRKRRQFKWLVRAVETDLFWNLALDYIMGAYVEMAFSALMNVQKIEWKTKGLYFNNINMFIGLFVVFFFPIILLIFLTYYFK